MLKITNLSVSVGSKKIISDINLAIGQGEIHVLLGPNGSGKTTLAMALMGHPNYKLQITPFDSTQGKNYKCQINLDGKDITKLEPDQRAKAGLFVSWQKPIAIPGVSVKNLLNLLIKKNLQEKITKISHNLGIKEDLLARSLNENFSGGETRKMELLQANILRPHYIILDEIDSGLDIDALKLVTNNIRQLTKFSGILLITHNLRILKYLKPDRIHILIHGHIVKSGDYKLGEIIDKKGYQWLSKN